VKKQGFNTNPTRHKYNSDYVFKSDIPIICTQHPHTFNFNAESVSFDSVHFYVELGNINRFFIQSPAIQSTEHNTQTVKAHCSCVACVSEPYR
jgi:hypothetical protein